jgi:hypothetical protein
MKGQRNAKKLVYRNYNKEFGTAIIVLKIGIWGFKFTDEEIEALI